MPDTLTRQQRSYCMSRVKNKGTDLERIIGSELRKRGLKFKKNFKQLPGSPDIAFPSSKLAVFIDGDYWHGYRFPLWKDDLPKFWQNKISVNRDRDRRNFRKIRNMGWRVIRIWKHQIKKDFNSCVVKIAKTVEEMAS